jgi:hypothetical protein
LIIVHATKNDCGGEEDGPVLSYQHDGVLLLPLIELKAHSPNVITNLWMAFMNATWSVS